MNHRIIGQYEGQQPGPLVIAFGGMHGNEPAGVRALEELFRMLQREPEANPGFRFRGKLVGLVGNLQACRTGARFLEQDLNRLWTPENLKLALEKPRGILRAEKRELVEILEVVHALLLETRPETLFLLDLHTTSAAGGIFCIPGPDAASLRLARSLHAPIILGLMDGIEGTLLHFAGGNHFQIGGHPKHSHCVAFEGGQHDDPLSVSRNISALVNGLRAVGCVRPEDVDNRHDDILRAYSERLPKVTRIRHVHHIRPGDAFRMRPGYANFQPILKDEWLADDVRGQVLSPEEGLILMPLYQKLGSDGFFLVQEQV